ncbi:hypothetical protein CPB97_001552 [Podila verticillata]|nr:hypothetical protein CPB97_001552 [Podila verticillata]
MKEEWRPEMAQDEYIDRPRQYDLTVLDPDNEVVYGFDEEKDKSRGYGLPDLSYSLYKYELKTGQASRERIKFPWMRFEDIKKVEHSGARESMWIWSAGDCASTMSRPRGCDMCIPWDETGLFGGQRELGWITLVEPQVQVVFSADEERRNSRTHLMKTEYFKDM